MSAASTATAIVEVFKNRRLIISGAILILGYLGIDLENREAAVVRDICADITGAIEERIGQTSGALSDPELVIETAQEVITLRENLEKRDAELQEANATVASLQAKVRGLEIQTTTAAGVRGELTAVQSELQLAREAAAEAVNTCEAFNTTLETEDDPQVCFARDEWNSLIAGPFGVLGYGAGVEQAASFRN